MDSVNKTLYIPLYGKAYVSSRNLFLKDEKAEAIWSEAGFPLKGKAKSRWLAYNMGMRAAVFDAWLKEKMERQPDAVVLHIGCGLDSRVSRIGTGENLWYDIDFPEVIGERKRYFAEDETYRMLPADVRDSKWLDNIPGGKAIVVMEGVSMYLQLPELSSLMDTLAEYFEDVQVFMDTYTVFAAKATKYKNPINSVGVTVVYGFDDPVILTKSGHYRFVGEHDLTPEKLIGQLPKGEQGFFRRMFAGTFAKKIYRLYAYEKK